MRTGYNYFGLLFVAFLVLITAQCQANPDAVCKDPNEEYGSCGTRCPDTCETVFQQSNKGEPRMCTMECVQGCFCKAGFVRNTVTNECVDPRFCKMPRGQVQGADSAAMALGTSLLGPLILVILFANFLLY